MLLHILSVKINIRVYISLWSLPRINIYWGRNEITATVIMWGRATSSLLIYKYFDLSTECNECAYEYASVILIYWPAGRWSLPKTMFQWNVQLSGEARAATAEANTPFTVHLPYIFRLVSDMWKPYANWVSSAVNFAKKYFETMEAVAAKKKKDAGKLFTFETKQWEKRLKTLNYFSQLREFGGHHTHTYIHC